jgi:uncharacterized protein
MATPPDGTIRLPRPKRTTKSALTLWAAIIAACLTVLIVMYMLMAKAPPPMRIVVASGGKTGGYYRFAHRYAEELKKEGLTVEVRETAGSVENLQLLLDDSSGVSIAIVQSGVASPDQIDRLSALGSLYREPLWIFYRGGKTLERLSELAGKRIGVGAPGSGTHAIAMQLLEANGIVGGDPAVSAKATLLTESVPATVDALQRGDLDAAFFVAVFDASYIQDVLKDENVRLMSVGQHDAYHRKFRFLSEVTVPAGLVNLGQNIPRQDISLLAPTAMLVVRNDLHPALVPILLAAATRIHGRGDELSKAGEFPSPNFTDFPVDEDAQHFYKFGPPMLQRILPFWLASLVDRLKFMIIPLLVLLMPVLRAAPPLVRWRIRRKIYLWYTVLKEDDQRLAAGMSPQEIDERLSRLTEIERQIAFVDVPLSYVAEMYHLRHHLRMMKEAMANLKNRGTGHETMNAQNPDPTNRTNAG